MIEPGNEYHKATFYIISMATDAAGYFMEWIYVYFYRIFPECKNVYTCM